MLGFIFRIVTYVFFCLSSFDSVQIMDGVVWLCLALEVLGSL